MPEIKKTKTLTFTRREIIEMIQLVSYDYGLIPENVTVGLEYDLDGHLEGATVVGDVEDD